MNIADPLERKIAAAIVDEAIRRDCTITVYDGGGCPVIGSNDREAILGALGTTGWDTLYFVREYRRIGWVTLVWGNGCDLISDASDTTGMDDLLWPAEKIAEEDRS